jgi:diacylglycerol kinase family enzyme
MRLCAVLNREGGTLKTTDLDAFSAHIRESFAGRGHEVAVVITGGEDLENALRTAFADESHEGVLAGGGDGTISAAAALALEHDKMLGVIPAGTMNLYARALGTPLEINQAVDSLAAGMPGVSDIATANGRPFLHQYSVGMHPRVVRQRNRYTFTSRFGKMGASVLAALDAISRPLRFLVEIELDGNVIEARASSVAVSNNPYGEGHLPYPDKLDQGKLGVYLVGPLSITDQAKLLADLALGTWRANGAMEEFTATSVALRFPDLRRAGLALMDGELVVLEREVELRILKGALKVLLPAAQEPPPA